MKIGQIDLGKYPILLAPMEDVTDPAFRLMCKKFGADMVYTEFVSSDALIRAVSKTAQKLSISDAERPVAIQIYGKDTETMFDRWKKKDLEDSRYVWLPVLVKDGKITIPWHEKWTLSIFDK